MKSAIARHVLSPRMWLLSSCAAALAVPLTAFAVTRPKPGLWQQYTESEINGRDVMAAMGTARKQMMENMSTTQRAMIEKRFGAINDDPHIVESCLSAEQVAKIDSPEDFVDQLNKDHESCRYTVPTIDGNTIRFHGSCAGAGNYNGDMDGTLVVTSPTAYSINFAGKGSMTTDGGAMPMELKGRIDAKWLSDDCGDIAPDE
jgi:hypothetical protein